MTDMCLCALLDTHLEIDGVANDVHLNGVKVVKKITIVPVIVAYGILVLREALLHVLLVIDIAFFHA